MLTRMVFRVLLAKDGVEALEVFREHSSKVHVVLSDLSMPRLIRPGIPAILASGHDESKVLSGAHLEHPQVFLPE